MPQTNSRKEKLTLEEWRARRALRRKKQREENFGRAAKMHEARLAMEAAGVEDAHFHHEIARMSAVRDGFTGNGAAFFIPPICRPGRGSITTWNTLTPSKSMHRFTHGLRLRSQPGAVSPARKFVYTVKVCELITHIKKFKGTKTLVKDFGMIADILGDRMGCFLFQLPPSYRFTKARLNQSSASSTRRGATSWNFATPAGGTRPSMRLSEGWSHLLLLQRTPAPG